MIYIYSQIKNVNNIDTKCSIPVQLDMFFN